MEKEEEAKIWSGICYWARADFAGDKICTWLLLLAEEGVEEKGEKGSAD